HLEKVLNLFYAADQEVARVIVGRSFSPARYVDLLVGSASGDSMIFDSSKFSVAVRRQKWTKIVEIQVKTDIPIKIAVGGISRIPFQGAPDLFARFTISPKSSGSGNRKAWREYCITRSRIAKHQSMSIQAEPTQ